MKKAFTLVELVITIVILSILIWVLFRVFIMISHIAVRIQHERWMHDEMIYVVQTIQNIIDQWDTQFNGEAFSWNYWYSTWLNLIWDSYTYTLWRNVFDDSLELVIWDANWWTFSSTYSLTNTNRLKVKDFYIKRVPFKNQAVYRNQMHEWFWLFMDLEIPNYDEERRWFNVDRDVQTFYNIRKYD